MVKKLHLAVAAWALLLVLGSKQQVAFQQLYLNAQSSRGALGQRRMHGWVSTNIRCVALCHILHDLHGMPDTGGWHHVVMPACNIPVRKNKFSAFLWTSLAFNALVPECAIARKQTCSVTRVRLLNDSCWLITCNRSKMPVLWWGAQGTGNTVACSLVTDVVYVPVSCCESMGVSKCPEAPLELHPCHQEHLSAFCRGGCSALLPLAGLCCSWRAWRVLMGSMKPSGWDLLCSCQKKTGNLLSPSGESVRCSSVRSVAWVLNHPDSEDLPRCQNMCWGKS